MQHRSQTISTWYRVVASGTEMNRAKRRKTQGGDGSSSVDTGIVLGETELRRSRDKPLGRAENPEATRCWAVRHLFSTAGRANLPVLESKQPFDAGYVMPHALLDLEPKSVSTDPWQITYSDLCAAMERSIANVFGQPGLGVVARYQTALEKARLSASPGSLLELYGNIRTVAWIEHTQRYEPDTLNTMPRVRLSRDLPYQTGDVAHGFDVSGATFVCCPKAGISRVALSGCIDAADHQAILDLGRKNNYVHFVAYRVDYADDDSIVTTWQEWNWDEYRHDMLFFIEDNAWDAMTPLDFGLWLAAHNARGAAGAAGAAPVRTNILIGAPQSFSILPAPPPLAYTVDDMVRALSYVPTTLQTMQATEQFVAESIGGHTTDPGFDAMFGDAIRQRARKAPGALEVRPPVLRQHETLTTSPYHDITEFRADTVAPALSETEYTMYIEHPYGKYLRARNIYALKEQHQVNEACRVMRSLWRQWHNDWCRSHGNLDRDGILFSTNPHLCKHYLTDMFHLFKYTVFSHHPQQIFEIGDPGKRQSRKAFATKSVHTRRGLRRIFMWDRYVVSPYRRVPLRTLRNTLLHECSHQMNAGQRRAMWQAGQKFQPHGREWQAAFRALAHDGDIGPGFEETDPQRRGRFTAVFRTWAVCPHGCSAVNIVAPLRSLKRHQDYFTCHNPECPGNLPGQSKLFYYVVDRSKRWHIAEFRDGSGPSPDALHDLGSTQDFGSLEACLKALCWLRAQRTPAPTTQCHIWGCANAFCFLQTFFNTTWRWWENPDKSPDANLHVCSTCRASLGRAPILLDATVENIATRHREIFHRVPDEQLYPGVYDDAKNREVHKLYVEFVSGRAADVELSAALAKLRLRF